MKFCFFSMDFRRFPLEYSFQMAAKYGVKGLEVFGARPHLYPADMTPARLNEIAGYKKKYGVEIPMYTPLCLGHTTNLCSQNPIERQDCMDHFRKCIDIAEYLEIPNMLLTADHPGYQTPRRVAWKQFVENMQELSSYADGKGVNLTIEAVTPMESPVITTSEDLRDVLDDIGRDNVNTMLEQMMQTAVQYIDTAMVGSIGTHATAAVGSTTTINWLVQSTIAAVGIGFLTFIAQACGADDSNRAKRFSSQAVLATLVCGTLFTVLTLSLSKMIPIWMQVDPAIRDLTSLYFFICYMPMLPRAASIIFGSLLRAAGDTKTPMQIGLMVNAINVILNFFFIYPTRTVSLFSQSFTVPGFGWGVPGAAAASAIAITAGGLCMSIALWRHPMISPRGCSLRPDWRILRPCLRVAFPNMLQRFGTCLGYVVFAAMINSLGEIPTAAHTIANTVESAFYIPGYGMQAAAATLSGNALGARNKERMRDLTILILQIEVLLMIVSGGLLLIFAPGMVSIFTKDAAVIALGAIVLRMVAVSEPFFGVSIVLEGMMQGVGSTVVPFVSSIAGMWGVRILGTFLCTQLGDMGLISAWACMITHNLFLCLMLLLYYLRGKWNPLSRMQEQ